MQRMQHIKLCNVCTFSLTGMDDPNSPFISLKNALKDEKRVKYYNDYLTNLLAAIK